jgi:hypothetical protein
MTDTKNINKKDQLAEYIGDSMEHPLVMIFTAKWHSHSDIVEIIAEKIMAADDKIRLIIIDADVDEDLFGVYKFYPCGYNHQEQTDDKED